MIQEEKANDYMLLDDTPVWVQIKKDQTTPMEVVVKDAVNILHFRGDLSFTKVDENGTPLANIAFFISDTKGESHIVWTDEMGITRRQLPIFHIRIIRIRKRQVRVSGLDRQT